MPNKGLSCCAPIVLDQASYPCHVGRSYGAVACLIFHRQFSLASLKTFFRMKGQKYVVLHEVCDSLYTMEAMIVIVPLLIRDHPLEAASHFLALQGPLQAL